MKKWIMCLLAIMVAGAASAATQVWNPAGTGIIPPSEGAWDNPNAWTGGSVPGENGYDVMVFNVPNAADCVVTNYTGGTNTIPFKMYMGEGPNAAGCVLRVASGGTLCLFYPDWSAVGYQNDASMVIEAGGAVVSSNRFAVGLVSGGDGTLDNYGDLSVAGTFQVGSEGGTGEVTCYPGSTVTAGVISWDDALVDLWLDASLTVTGDVSAVVSNYVDQGLLLGNRLTNNVSYVVNTNGAVTNTVITVIPSIPNVAGLTLEETTNVLTQFDYTVGIVSEGYEPGAVADTVIAQDPAAGSAPAASGTPINLTIQTLSIPNLVGTDIDDAIATLNSIGLTTGTLTEVYTLFATPGLVTAQSPAPGGIANEGDAVDLTHNERLAAGSTETIVGSGDWMTPGNFSAGVVPERETQNIKVVGNAARTLSLTNLVAVSHLDLNAGSTLNIDDGGHMIAGFGIWTGIGYSSPATVNVYTNGYLQCLGPLLFSRSGGDGAVLNIDGGLVSNGDGGDNWFSLGSAGNAGTVNIANGGTLDIYRWRTDWMNGVLNIAEGTIIVRQSDALNLQLQQWLDAGKIQVAEGYIPVVKAENGNAVLRTFTSLYDAWAYDLGVGAEGEDDDFDGASNFYEYVFKGDPTNAAVTGVEPILTDGGATYKYVMRNDNTNLVYSVMTAPDLVTGPWTEATVTSSNITDGAYDEVINTIPLTEDQLFIRTQVE